MQTTDAVATPVAPRHRLASPVVRIDLDGGPLDVVFPNGNEVTVMTPSNCGTYPELQFRQRGVGYQVDVNVVADPDGSFPVPTDGPRVTDCHHININRMDGKGTSTAATWPLIRSAMIAVNLAVAREPAIRVRAERAYLNNQIFAKEAKRRELAAELHALEAELSTLADRETAVLEQMLAPIDPKYTEPGIHLLPVSV